MAVKWVQKKNVQLMYLLELAAEGVEVQWKNMQVMHLHDLAVEGVKVQKDMSWVVDFLAV